MSENDTRDLEALIDEGLTGKEIAQRLGISRRTLSRRLSKAGLSLEHNQTGPRAGRPPAVNAPCSKQEGLDIVEGAQERGFTLGQAGEELGMTAKTLAGHLADVGVSWWR